MRRYAAPDESRGDRVRRPEGLLRGRVQPRGRVVDLAAADRLGRGGDHRAAPPGALAERLLHAEGSGRRLLSTGGDAARAVRRPEAGPGERRARPRLRTPGAVGDARRAPPQGTLDRAF